MDRKLNHRTFNRGHSESGGQPKPVVDAIWVPELFVNDRPAAASH